MRVMNFYRTVQSLTAKLPQRTAIVAVSSIGWLSAGTAWASVEPGPPVSAPVPPAAWMGLALLAGIGVLGGLRKRLKRSDRSE